MCCDLLIVQIIANVISLVLVTWFIYLIVCKISSKVKKDGNTNVHILYITAISAFLIIELVSYICVGKGDGQKIFDYISFAATLSSLILSVVAIIYTIVLSKDGKENNLAIKEAISTLHSTINDFQNKSSQLSSISQRLEDVYRIAKNTNDNLVKASNEDFSISSSGIKTSDSDSISLNSTE